MYEGIYEIFFDGLVFEYNRRNIVVILDCFIGL